jgi:probable HAF family extracellular repeat protein
MFGSGKPSTPPRLAASAAACALATLLAACGGGGGYHPVPAPTSPTEPTPPAVPTPPADLGPLYDFTELGVPGSTFGVVDRQGIANGGLVAGTSVDAAGVSHAFLYNGKTNIDLGTFGGTHSRAFAVNRCGQVAGWGMTTSGVAHAFFYDGSLHDLGTLGGAESWGTAISTCGKVAGWAVTGAGQQHAFYYDGRTMRDLGTLGGSLSGATDVNSVGQVVGYATIPGNAVLHAFLYDARTGAPIQDIGPADRIAQAVDINEAGQVAISTRDADGQLRAFRYDAGAGALQDLGLLPDSQGSEPHAINAGGQVAGFVYYPDGRMVAFVHDGTAMRSLGTLNGGRFSDANAINASGLVVGYAVDGPAGSERAAAWGPGYGLVDLNTRVKDLPPGVELLSALAVADDGAIAVRTRTGLGLLRPRK